MAQVKVIFFTDKGPDLFQKPRAFIMIVLHLFPILIVVLSLKLTRHGDGTYIDKKNTDDTDWDIRRFLVDFTTAQVISEVMHY